MLAVVGRTPLLLALLPPLGFGATFEDAVRPFLARHCVACHGEQMQMAELRLDIYADETEALRHPGVWEDVLRMVRNGKMPPPGSPAPASGALDALTAWIEARRSAMQAHRRTDPGRVTARRLNRAEYNNTVRDLLGVALRPANEFPVDDSGYGFDNIGDVLSLSPLLMEKYLDAAGKLARAAIWERPRLAEPTRFRVQASRDAGNSAAIGRVAAFTADGSLQLRHRFPAAGLYRFSFGATDRRQRSEDNSRYLADLEPPPPRLMTLTLNGRRMATKAVEAAQYFDRTEEVTHRVDPGEKDIWLGFIDFAGQPMNPNEEYAQRKLWVDYLEINGPYDADPRPPPDSHRKILTCLPEGEEPWRPCAEEVLGRLALRAYRRPPSTAEMARLMGLATQAMAQGESFEGMVQTALQVILVSPQFLFRIEGDPGPGDRQGARELDGYELASRLSYFLWSSMPDDELLAAAAGRLRQSAEVRNQVRRMLADPKSAALVENFGGQWLQLRNLAQAQPDAARFPEFNEALRSAMLSETQLFFQEILQSDRSVLEFLDSDFTFLNARLAQHYGVAGVQGAGFRLVELSDDRRGGLLGQASMLTVSSYPTRTSPVLRGLWVLENILGQSPPPPPPDVPELEVQEGELSGTLRQQLEQHRSNAGCMSCHLVMDAIGFGLENYDAVGKWRTHDGQAPVDTSGVLPGNFSFQTPAELRRILVQTEADSFSRNLTKKLLTYALGRGVGRDDNPAVDEIQRKLAEADYRFSGLIDGIVASPPFRMRSRAAEAPEQAGGG